MIALVDLIDEHPRAIEHECIRLGVRLRWLGTDYLSWGDLLTIVQEAPLDSAITRAISPDAYEWSTQLKTNQLMHSNEFSSRQLVWTKTEDAAKNRLRSAPKPAPAPWVEPDESREVKHFGSKPIPLDDLAEFLGWSA